MSKPQRVPTIIVAFLLIGAVLAIGKLIEGLPIPADLEFYAVVGASVLVCWLVLRYFGMWPD